MKVFLRYLRYFFTYKWRITAGLFSVAMMSLADTVSAFLVAQLFEILQKIGDIVNAGKELALDIPIEFLGTTFYQLNISGSGETMRLIVAFAVMLLGIILVKVCFVYVREYVMSSAQQKILMRFRVELFDTILFLPVRYFDQQKTGRIMSRITNDVNNMEQSLYLDRKSVV